MKRFIIVALVILAALALSVVLFIQSEKNSLNESDVLSTNGLHWHANLAIYIKGEKQAVPKDIGIGIVHDPFHTHDDTGELHLEFDGKVTKQDTELGRLFKNWRKIFTADCIFEFCNNAEGRVKFLVNGKINTEFENYQVKDKDNLEIRYE